MTLLEDPSTALRAGMRRLASGVCVISTTDGHERHAMTATSVTSVSDSPPSLLVCINRQANLFDVLSHTPRFAVSVLGADQQNISTHCASSEPGETRFTLGQWGDKNGLPYLRDAQAVFFCQTVRQLIQGTHLIVIGEVDKVLVAKEPINPLLYADGRYWKLLEE